MREMRGNIGIILYMGILITLNTICEGHLTNNTECSLVEVWRTEKSANQSASVRGSTDLQCAMSHRPSLLAGIDETVLQIYLQAFCQIINQLKWTTVVLISDENTDLIVDRISQVLIDVNCRYIHYSIRDDTSDLRILNWINGTYHNRRHTGLHYVLMSDDVNIQRVIKLAGGYDALDKGKTALYYFSRWLVISGRRGVEIVTQNVGALDHVAVMTLGEVNKEVVVNESYTEQCPFWQPSFDSAPCNTNQVDLLTLFYKPQSKILCCIGFWSNHSLNVKENIFPNARFGFNNRTLIVGTNMWPPFVYRDVNNGTEIFTGYTMELLSEVANTLNFSYILKVPDDGEWGRMLDGRWTGLVGDLYYSNVDLVAAPIAQTTMREEGCDFTYPYFYEFSVITIRMPDPMGQKWRALLDIFSWPVMVLVIVSLPITALVMYVMEKVDPVPNKKENCWPYRNAGGYTMAAWYLFGALLSQGGVLNPKSISRRTLVGFWWLYCIVVTATFTGQLMATLTVSSVRPPFQDMAGMVKQEDFTWGTAGGGTVISNSLISSRDPIFQRVWQGILKFQSTDPDVLSPDINVHFKKVQQGSYAYLTDKSGVLELLSSDCQLSLLKEEFFPTQYAFALPVGSPFVDMFSDRIFTVQESGLLKIWEKNWWPRNNCTGLPRTQAVTMGMMDVQSAYYVLVIGVVIGFMALGLETLKNLIDRKKLRTPPKRVRNPCGHSTTDNHSVEMTCPDGITFTAQSEDNCKGAVYEDINGDPVNIREIKQPD